MNSIQQKLSLRIETSKAWFPLVLENFDEFLVDHAACERKASAQAMSFVIKYAQREALVEPMICLAKEELAHFHEIYKILHKRGLSLCQDKKDPYLQALLKMARHGTEENFLDRLLIFAVVEARGCERFFIVGDLHPDPEMKLFYNRLGREEAGHYTIFIKLAKLYFDSAVVQNRLDEWLNIEAEIVQSLELRPAVH